MIKTLCDYCKKPITPTHADQYTDAICGECMERAQKTIKQMQKASEDLKKLFNI